MTKDLHGGALSAAASSRLLQEMDCGLTELNEPPGLAVDVPDNARLVAMKEKESVGAEKFRVLAARLQYFRKQRQLKKVVITSTIKGEGKSVVSANLAVTLARRQRTLLIDGDLRQSGLRELLTTHGLAGVTEWWREPADVSEFFLRVNSLSLWVLPAGEAMGSPWRSCSRDECQRCWPRSLNGLNGSLSIRLHWRQSPIRMSGRRRLTVRSWLSNKERRRRSCCRRRSKALKT